MAAGGAGGGGDAAALTPAELKLRLQHEATKARFGEVADAPLKVRPAGRARLEDEEGLGSWWEGSWTMQTTKGSARTGRLRALRRGLALLHAWVGAPLRGALA